MDLLAKDVMVTDFSTLKENDTVQKAMRFIEEGKVRTRRDTSAYGIMVTDDQNNLVGMISTFSILYHIRPPFLNYWQSDSQDLWAGEFESYINMAKSLKVKSIMSTPVYSVNEDDHLITIIDIMVRKKIHRVPVVSQSRIVGIIYLNDVFSKIYRRFFSNQ